MATWKHKDINRFGITDLNALNLVPFLVTAHYEDKYKELLKEKIHQSKYKVKILADHQALLIEGGDIKLVGKGKEIKL